MSQPVIFKSRHRAKFFEIDPYGHLGTTSYVNYFIDHRFIGLRERLGYDLHALNLLPVAFYTSNLQLEFIRPIKGDDEFEIESSVIEYTEASCIVACEMRKLDGKVASKCRFTLVCIDKTTSRPIAWPKDVISKFFENPTNPNEAK